MLESIKFPSLLCFSFQIGDILLTCHMARLCSKVAIGADWLLVLKQVWSSGAIVGSHVLSITSFDQDYNFLKAMCIYIPIRRLNNISVDYMFHYKYVLHLLILGEKERAKTHAILSPLDHEQLQPFLVYYIIQYICLSMLNYHLSLSVLGYPE